MKIVISFDDVTSWFFSSLHTLLKNQEHVFVGLGGGTSFDVWYASLVLSNEWSAIAQDRLRWCVTDERIHCSPEERNDRRIQELFLLPLEKRLGVKMIAIFPEKDDDGKRYSGKIPTLDIGFFGMGPDGHTASLFPHHPVLDSKEKGFVAIDHAPKNPPQRITLSPSSLGDIAYSCLCVVGEGKKNALENFFNPKITTHECPSKLLQPDLLLDMTH